MPWMIRHEIILKRFFSSNDLIICGSVMLFFNQIKLNFRPVDFSSKHFDTWCPLTSHAY